MPKPDPSPAFRYTGRRTGPAPFPGVPMRDLYADDVERLPPSLMKNATGGAKPLYVKADRAAPKPPKPPRTRPAKKSAAGGPVAPPTAQSPEAPAGDQGGEE